MKRRSCSEIFDWDERVFNSRINNKAIRDFWRGVKLCRKFLPRSSRPGGGSQQTQSRGSLEPRGTGKTSLDTWPRMAERGKTVEDMLNVLLQICSKATAGYQNCQSGPWKDRQDQHRYGRVNCSEIIAQLECLRFLR